MLANWRLFVISAGTLLLSGAGATFATRSTAADAAPAPALTYDLSGTLTLAPAPAPADKDAAAEPARAEAALDPEELECMAKVVMHEAGNQPRVGQIAVAQTLINRMQSGRFAGSICAVANQPGQYFRTASYRPARDARWESAVAVARDAMLGNADPVAPGALFFRAAASPQTGFFARRTHVATIGGHVFYR